MTKLAFAPYFNKGPSYLVSLNFDGRECFVFGGAVDARDCPSRVALTFIPNNRAGHI